MHTIALHTHSITAHLNQLCGVFHHKIINAASLLLAFSPPLDPTPSRQPYHLTAHIHSAVIRSCIHGCGLAACTIAMPDFDHIINAPHSALPAHAHVHRSLAHHARSTCIPAWSKQQHPALGRHSDAADVFGATARKCPALLFADPPQLLSTLTYRLSHIVCTRPPVTVCRPGPARRLVPSTSRAAGPCAHPTDSRLSGGMHSQVSYAFNPAGHCARRSSAMRASTAARHCLSYTTARSILIGCSPACAMTFWSGRRGRARLAVAAGAVALVLLVLYSTSSSTVPHEDHAAPVPLERAQKPGAAVAPPAPHVQPPHAAAHVDIPATELSTKATRNPNVFVGANKNQKHGPLAIKPVYF